MSGIMTNLSVVLLLAAMVSVPAQAGPELHLILVCDTAHPEFGEGFDINFHKMKSVFLDNVATRQLRITPLVSSRFGRGEPLSKSALQQAVQTVSVTPEDTLIVYLACAHGGDAQSGAEFLFEGSDEGFSRRSILHAIKSRNVRLGGLITDTCRSYMFRESQMTAISALGPELPETSPLFEQLFFESEGLLDWSASSATEDAVYVNNYRDLTDVPSDQLTKSWILGQRSYAGIPQDYAFNFGFLALTKAGEERRTARGGLFTEAFANTLSEHADEHRSWGDLQALTQRTLTRYFRDECPLGRVRAGRNSVTQRRQSIVSHSTPLQR